jgi:hypothetical protein
VHIETLASHRAQRLEAILPNAFEFGFAEIEPELEPLKVSHPTSRVYIMADQHCRTSILTK